MSDEEFLSLLDELGGDIARWPAHLREDAQALLTRSPEARAGLAAMQAVESLLAASSLSAFDTAAMAARATQAAQARRPLLTPALRRASFAALGVTALAAGILVGMIPPSGSAIVGSVQMALNGSGSDVQ